MSQIYQSDVDTFGACVPPSFPSILITISVEHSPHTVKKLDHGIPLKGIEPSNMMIYIVRSLSSGSTGKYPRFYLACITREAKIHNISLL